MDLERYICPPLAEPKQCINLPFLRDLCASAPLRLCEKQGNLAQTEILRTVSRKGAKAQRRKDREANPKRWWFLSEVDND
jgi:hypothetical protein